jgi:hypothetical protein
LKDPSRAKAVQQSASPLISKIDFYCGPKHGGSVSRVRLLHVFLYDHRWIDELDFEAGPLTVLFGKNNAGKTNILEGLYAAFGPADQQRAIRTRRHMPREPHLGSFESTRGAVYVELQEGVPFDDEVSAAVGGKMTPPAPRRIAFARDGLLPSDPREHGFPSRNDTVAGPGLHVLFLDWDFEDLHNRVEDAIASLAAEKMPGVGEWPWLERIELTKRSEARRLASIEMEPESSDIGEEILFPHIREETIELEEGDEVWRVHPAVRSSLDQLASLATDLLPDFIDGRIFAEVIEPRHWGISTKVGLYYGDYPYGVEVDVAGRGAARWGAAATQIALHLMAEYPDIMTLRDLGVDGFSGQILLIDEPEAHLHPSAAASVVRWCQRMVRHGFTVVAASHHEEFLRAPASDVTLVHVTADSLDPDSAHYRGTNARTLDALTTTQLQELATDVGMHPASILSLNRAILFVEGILDEAVLDEYGGLDLDAAGVKIIPIHGTKNIEGIVDSEVIAQIGIKMGILTDATDPATMNERSGRKRSSEERKVIKVLERARERGLPEPAVFGVPENDLLFALPADAIRECLNGPFPGWNELVAECRQALGKGPSDSVDWKSYAADKYGLQITTAAGVRNLVRSLDLANVTLPSIRRVIDEVVNWAK